MIKVSLSSSIDSTFSELMTAVVKKSLRYLKTVDYWFSMDHESLGWTGDSVVHFRVKPKGSLPVDRSKLLFYSFSRLPSLITGKGGIGFLSEASYDDLIGHLEIIGQDILNETKPGTCPRDAALMPNAKLRARIFELESHLAEFAASDPELFESYLEMIRLINSVPKQKIIWVINLIAALSEDQVTPGQVEHFESHLGQEFIQVFLDNVMIGQLMEQPDLVISLSYLYPLLKMLFIVFGYARLSPVVITDSVKPVFDDTKNRGAYVTRGYVPMHCYKPRPIIEQPAPPIPPEDYDYIKQFTSLYPTLIQLMGGVEEFPEDTVIKLKDIPPNYDLLPTIADYLWRFNDWSHAKNNQKPLKPVKVSSKIKLIVNA